jgi:hypothetical protein
MAYVYPDYYVAHATCPYDVYCDGIALNYKPYTIPGYQLCPGEWAYVSTGSQNLWVCVTAPTNANLHTMTIHVPVTTTTVTGTTDATRKWPISMLVTEEGRQYCAQHWQWRFKKKYLNEVIPDITEQPVDKS